MPSPWPCARASTSIASPIPWPCSLRNLPRTPGGTLDSLNALDVHTQVAFGTARRNAPGRLPYSGDALACGRARPLHDRGETQQQQRIGNAYRAAVRPSSDGGGPVYARQSPRISAAPISGRSLNKVSRSSSGCALAISLALRSRQASVWTRFAAMTDGSSRLAIGTSVDPPRTLVLIGQQIKRPVRPLYSRLLNTSAGRYLPISLPFVGSKSSQITSPRSGM